MSRAPSGDHLLRAILKCTTKTNTFLHVSWFVEIRKCIGSSSTFGGVARRRLSPAKVIQGYPGIPRFALNPVVFHVFESRISKIECEKSVSNDNRCPFADVWGSDCYPLRGDIWHHLVVNGRSGAVFRKRRRSTIPMKCSIKR